MVSLSRGQTSAPAAANGAIDNQWFVVDRDLDQDARQVVGQRGFSPLLPEATPSASR